MDVNMGVTIKLQGTGNLGGRHQFLGNEASGRKSAIFCIIYLAWEILTIVQIATRGTSDFYRLASIEFRASCLKPSSSS